MTRAILTEADLAALVTDLVRAGKRVIAPVPAGPDGEQTEYRAIERLEDASLDGTLPRRSLKEFFRPSQHDPLPPRAPQIILGARPCDAAGVELLDNVMGWEYRDEHWRARRAATTIVTIACPEVESSCFCTAVGLGPDSTRGADALLVPLDDAPDSPARRRIAEQLRRCVDLFLFDSQPFPDAALLQASAPPPRAPRRWAARAVTLKGAALLHGRGQPEADAAERDRAGAATRSARDRVGDNVVALQLGRPHPWLDPHTEQRLGVMAADGGELIDPMVAARAGSGVKRLPEWLARNFDHEVWRSFAPRCRGCGNCSAVCSTSPCFDVDEHDRDRRRSAGARPARPAFAAPPTRTEQFRQRVMHKFSTHPSRFQEFLCTGCGRCSRTCEGGMNLPAILGQLVQLAGPQPRGSVT